MFDIGEPDSDNNAQSDSKGPDWDTKISDARNVLSNHVTKKPFQKTPSLSKEAPFKVDFNDPTLVAFRTANLITLLAHFNIKSPKDLQRARKLLSNPEIMQYFEKAYLTDPFTNDSYIAVNAVEEVLDRIIDILFKGTNIIDVANPVVRKKVASLFIKLLSTPPTARLNTEALIRMYLKEDVEES